MKKNDIQKLLNISGDLEKLAKKFVLNADDEESLRVSGTILDSAHRLRKAAENIWKYATEQ